MKVTLRVERRSERDRFRTWGARKARRAERRLRRMFWGSYMPEYGALVYGGGAYTWVGKTDWSDQHDDEPILSPVETAARALVQALPDRIKELEDPCKDCDGR